VILDLKLTLIRGEGDIKVSEVWDGGKNVIANKRKCPFCNAEMSSYSGAYKEIVLTVLGSPRVSKSTTLTACAYYFKENNSADGLPVRWSAYEGDDDWEVFNSQCLMRYRNNEEVVATQNIADGAAIPRFSVRVTMQGLPGGRTRNYVLSVVDLPGELMDNDKSELDPILKKKYSELYKNVDVIWYCTDCAEIKQITSKEELKKLGYSDGKVVPIIDIEEKIEQISNLLGREEGDEVPVAFIIGKCDFLEEDYGSDYRICQGKRNDRGRLEYYTENGGEMVLDGRKLFHYMEGIRSIITRSAGGLDQKIRDKFPYHSYMAISGYGHGFGPEDGKNKPLKPWNTELPFLWSMAMLGYIRVEETVTVRGRWWKKTEITKLYNATADNITRMNLSMGGKDKNPAYQEHR